MKSNNNVVALMLRLAWLLELLIALFILLMTVVQMVLTAKDSLFFLSIGDFDLTEFFSTTMTIVVGLEFVKMLILHTPRAVTDVLLFAIARQLVLSHTDSMDTLLGVAAVALIFFIKKYLHTVEDSLSPVNLVAVMNKYLHGKKAPLEEKVSQENH